MLKRTLLVSLAVSLVALLLSCGAAMTSAKKCPPELLAQSPVKIVCFGDSITAGKWPAILQERLDKEAQGKYKIINRGQSGDTTSGAYYRMKSHILNELPCIVLIEFGINDSSSPYWGDQMRVNPDEYRTKMTGICQAVSNSGGYPILIVNHPLVFPDLDKVGRGEDRKKKVTDYWTRPGNGRTPTQNLETYNQIVREIAAQHGIQTIDIPKLMEKRNINPVSILDDDGCHLTDEGNKTYAELVHDAIKGMLVP